MTLTLNLATGVLHFSPRCAGHDDRFLYRFQLESFEELLGFVGMPFSGLCRKEFRRGR